MNIQEKHSKEFCKSKNCKFISQFFEILISKTENLITKIKNIAYSRSQRSSRKKRLSQISNIKIRVQNRTNNTHGRQRV